MSGEAGNPTNPFGSAQLAALQWVPPKPKVLTEPERAGAEATLRINAAFGQAIGAPFDVAEELHAHGLKTGEEIAEEQKAAEAAKAAAAEQKATRKTEAAERAADRATLDSIARQLRELEKGGLTMVQVYDAPAFDLATYRGPIPLANLTPRPLPPANYIDPGAVATAVLAAASANAAWFSWPASWAVSAMAQAAQLPGGPPLSPSLTQSQAAAALLAWQSWPASGWASASPLVAEFGAALAAYGGTPTITSTPGSSVAANAPLVTIVQVLAAAPASAVFDTTTAADFPYNG